MILIFQLHLYHVFPFFLFSIFVFINFLAYRFLLCIGVIMISFYNVQILQNNRKTEYILRDDLIIDDPIHY